MRRGRTGWPRSISSGDRLWQGGRRGHYGRSRCPGAPAACALCFRCRHHRLLARRRRLAKGSLKLVRKWACPSSYILRSTPPAEWRAPCFADPDQIVAAVMELIRSSRTPSAILVCEAHRYCSFTLTGSFQCRVRDFLPFNGVVRIDLPCAVGVSIVRVFHALTLLALLAALTTHSEGVLAPPGTAGGAGDATESGREVADCRKAKDRAHTSPQKQARCSRHRIHRHRAYACFGHEWRAFPTPIPTGISTPLLVAGFANRDRDGGNYFRWRLMVGAPPISRAHQK